MKNPKFLTIVCQAAGCRVKFEITYSKDREIVARILYFAICPNGHPVHPLMIRRYRGNWHCKNCHVAQPFVRRKTKEICESCYFTSYWNSKKSCEKVESSKVLENEGKLSSSRTDGHSDSATGNFLPVQNPKDKPDTKVSGALQRSSREATKNSV